MSKTAQYGKRDVLRVFSFAATLLMFSLSFAGAKANAQTAVPRSTPAPPQSPSPDNKDEPPLTSFEEEIRAKRAIKMAEKDHQENVERAKEVAGIAKDLQTALKDKKTIDREAAKKIERLEKLTKKIRGEAGGEDEEIEITDRPSDINSAIKQIAESAESLSKSVQNTPRQVVSASVIGNANVLLELIKLLRGFDSHP
jgi:hypothetical protein